MEFTKSTETLGDLMEEEELTDVSHHIPLLPDTISMLLKQISIDWEFFGGCENLFKDYRKNACEVTTLNQLPFWTHKVLERHWSTNGGRIELGQNAHAVLHARYARCWIKCRINDDDDTEHLKELTSPLDASEKEKIDMIHEPAEVIFYRVAMAAIAIRLHQALVCYLDSKKVPGASLNHVFGTELTQLKHLAYDFFEMMCTLRFLPAGRTIRNAGAGKPVVANCVVLDFKPQTLDNIPVLYEAMRLQERGSGVGFAFHMIQPGQAGNSNIGANGMLVFANTFLDCIKDTGRKGANMAVMSVEHPDILDFIFAKSRSEFSLPNFNISVSLSDRFMTTLRDAPNSQWICNFNGEDYLPREYTREKNRMNIIKFTEKVMSVQEVFDLLISQAHRFGDPGCIFLDTVNRLDPSPKRINACNPCGEQFLHDGDVCNLGSLNLDQFIGINETGVFTNFTLLEDTSRSATDFLDCIIDLSDYHESFRDSNRREHRRIGLGIMGLADMLYHTKIPYDSKRGRERAREIMFRITQASQEKSHALALRYGCFPAWKESTWAPKNQKMRNLSVTTIPPTGSTSMIPGVSSGCEPNFCLAFEQRHILDGNTTVRVFNTRFEDVLTTLPKLNQTIIRKHLSLTGDLRGLHGSVISDNLQSVFCTAMTISGMDHLKMIICLQKHTSNAVTKTINLPNGATKEEIGEIYQLAWKKGCKGLTIYRDGSRTVQVLHKGASSTEDGAEQEPEKLEERELIESLEVSGEDRPIGSSLTPDIDSDGEEEMTKSNAIIDVYSRPSCRTPGCEGVIVMNSARCFTCPDCLDEGCMSRINQLVV